MLTWNNNLNLKYKLVKASKTKQANTRVLSSMEHKTLYHIMVYV